ncbi:MAG: FkbM family methyltransferase [Anaerolinea sp.]|nr:FkbM family methyltransferase [Anaerolinea sp.]
MSRYSQDFWHLFGKAYHQALDRRTSPGIVGQVKRAARATLGKWRFQITNPRLKFLEQHRAEHEQVYEWLSDDPSRQVMLAVIMGRLIGYPNVTLPITPTKQAEAHTYAINNLRRETHTLPTYSEAITDYLDKYELHPLGIPLTLHSHENLVAEIFMFQQYRYAVGSNVVEIGSGDVVIDAGACWGDTVVFFAQQAGESGSVHAFEFEDANLHILRANLDLNPALKARIHIVERAVWDQDDVTLSFDANGVKSKITEGGKFTVSTRTIDTYVREQGLPSVDFIKMDIEGAELAALKGAADTIRRFKPRLAIAIYHSPEDFFIIPQYIKSLVPEYALYIGHFTPVRHETILFAEAKSPSP